MVAFRSGARWNLAELSNFWHDLAVAKYHTGSHTKHRLQYPLVWIPKYRLRVLRAKIAARLKGLLYQACRISAILILGVVLWDHAVRAASLVEIIEGAKKEGTVSVKFLSGLTPKSMERLRREIMEKFGADLKILSSPPSDFPQDLSQAIMEYGVQGWSGSIL